MSTINALFKKTAHGQSAQPFDAINLIAGEGIEGDVAKNSQSPRQVLVVRRADLEAFALPVGYLTENIVIDGVSEGDFQPGRTLAFTGGARVHLVFHCEPCQSIAERVPKLRSIIGRRGLLGVVTQSGQVLAGTRCESLASQFVAMSSTPSRRVHKVISCLPTDKVLDYATLLTAAGLQRAYFRAIPRYLKTAEALGLKVNRVLPKQVVFDHPEFFNHRWEPKILDLLGESHASAF
jgi:hypothetical protein